MGLGILRGSLEHRLRATDLSAFCARCTRYEKDSFNTGGGGGSADYAYMLLFGFVGIEASLLLLFYQPFLMFTEALRFYICYVWSRKNPGMSVSFWGIPINALYVPWVMVAMR